MRSPSERPSTWFVTGTSRGLGLELVAQLLRRGDDVAATTRSTDRSPAAIGPAVDTSGLLPLTVDPRDEHVVEEAVRQTVQRFGGLDVVVNNAGYGFLAAVEETSAREVRDMLDLQGSQLGDPAKGATAVIEQVVAGTGPLRLLLGSDAQSYATAEVDALRANLDVTARTAATTDHLAA